MYEAYYHLHRRPFSTTPDPTCFFAPDPIQELFDELILRAESGQGIGILTAAAGTGKSLLCRKIAADLAGRFTPVFLANANFPTRRALFERLCREGEQTVGALTAQSGVSQPAVSKHLGVLRQAGLVRDRHAGRQTHYSAQLGALAPLVDWTRQMAGFWQDRFDDLEDLLKRMDQ
jgi:DNA-binding transcriptional ArsR family regulator